MANLDYSFNVHRLSEEDGGGYLVEFPDLPGCMADGETIEDAIADAKDACEAWIEAAHEFGREIPKPKSDDDFSGQWRVRTPKSLHAALSRKAKEENVSLNTLVVCLLAEGLGKKQVV
ncbi:type II toxin-antitoxin system HicB family antitoxin [Piscirickettsia litoralis]|uniref:HicB-like antitoxin of toxin-antitoxin system domain-containing protein n=1 Tax=Piscirickettsia litoralis TaxID=1891921 RepID=A0ABX2ZWS4_9GAMM|nr:type II toxin-antitoxin system HicB family antitoxin [Piscirickettsia litoralis]ODN40948.1 hypothetical protein BGC07_18980 [Piscirickettsia litoralis]